MNIHTPGPWVADKHSIHVQIGSRGKRIAVVQGIDLESPEEMNANSSLISAAPELLEALEGLLFVVKRISDNGWSDSLAILKGITEMNKAEDAIRKANDRLKRMEVAVAVCGDVAAYFAPDTDMDEIAEVSRKRVVRR